MNSDLHRFRWEQADIDGLPELVNNVKQNDKALIVFQVRLGCVLDQFKSSFVFQ